MTTAGQGQPIATLSDLEEQLRFLAMSAAAFDLGEHNEAKRLAVAVRVIAHTTRSSTSLLTHLGLADSLQWVTSGWYVPGNLVATDGLTTKGPGQTIDGLDRYMLFAKTAEEVLQFRHDWVPFDTWWKQVVLRDLAGREYTRRSIVLLLANKAGGAHYDKPSADDAALFDGRDFGWWQGDKPIFVGSGRVLLSMRTIASEIEVAFASERNKAALAGLAGLAD